MERFVFNGYEVRYGVGDDAGTPAVVAEFVHAESGAVVARRAFRDGPGLDAARGTASDLFGRRGNVADLHDLFRAYAKLSGETATLGPSVNAVLRAVLNKFLYDHIVFPGIGMRLSFGAIKALGVLRWIADGATPADVERNVLAALGADAAPVLAPGATVTIAPVAARMDARYAGTPLAFTLHLPERDRTGTRTLALAPVQFAWWEIQRDARRAEPRVPHRIADWVKLFPFDPLVFVRGDSEAHATAEFIVASRLCNSRLSTDNAAAWLLDLCERHLTSYAGSVRSPAKPWSRYITDRNVLAAVPVFAPSPGEATSVEADFRPMPAQPGRLRVRVECGVPLVFDASDVPYAMRMEFPKAAGALAPVAGADLPKAAAAPDYGFTPSPAALLAPAVVAAIAGSMGNHETVIARLADGRFALVTPFVRKNYSKLKGDVVKNADMIEAFRVQSESAPIEWPVAFLQAQGVVPTGEGAAGTWRSVVLRALDGLDAPAVVGSAIGAKGVALVRALYVEPMIFRPGGDVHTLREALTAQRYTTELVVYGLHDAASPEPEKLRASELDFADGSYFRGDLGRVTAEFSLVPLLREHVGKPIPLRAPNAENPAPPVSVVPYDRKGTLLAVNVNGNYAVLAARASRAAVAASVGAIPGLSALYAGDVSTWPKGKDPNPMLDVRAAAVVAGEYPACPVGVYRHGEDVSVVLRLAEPDGETLVAVEAAHFARALLLCGGAPRMTAQFYGERRENLFVTLWDRVGDAGEAPVLIGALSVAPLPPGLSAETAPACLLGAMRHFAVADLEREAREFAKAVTFKEPKDRRPGFLDVASGGDPSFVVSRAPLLAHLKRFAALWKARGGNHDVSASVTLAASASDTVAVSFGARTAGARVIVDAGIIATGVVRVSLSDLTDALADDRSSAVRFAVERRGDKRVLRVTGSAESTLAAAPGSLRDGNLRELFAAGRVDLFRLVGPSGKQAMLDALGAVARFVSLDDTRPHLQCVAVSRGHPSMTGQRFPESALALFATDGHRAGGAIVPSDGTLDVLGMPPFLAFIPDDFAPCVEAFLRDSIVRGAVVRAWGTFEYESAADFLAGKRSTLNATSPVLYLYGNDGSFAWNLRGVEGYPHMTWVFDSDTFRRDPLATVAFKPGAAERLAAVASVADRAGKRDGFVLRMLDGGARRAAFAVDRNAIERSAGESGAESTRKRALAKVAENVAADGSVVEGVSSGREVVGVTVRCLYLAEAFAACERNSAGVVVEEYADEALDPIMVRSEDRTTYCVVMPMRA